jgi:preprotein translocase subunit YajC
MPLFMQSTQSAPAWSPILLMVGMFAILYFFMIRPQQKRAKEHASMLKALKEGDRVLTSGGVYGSIVKVKEDRVILRVDDNCKLEVALGNIAAKLEK